jgi:hypothetical protein
MVGLFVGWNSITRNNRASLDFGLDPVDDLAAVIRPDAATSGFFVELHSRRKARRLVARSR